VWGCCFIQAVGTPKPEYGIKQEMQSPHLFCTLLLTPFSRRLENTKKLNFAMEESTSQENAQSVPSLEEKMYKIDYETTDYVYYRDDRLERILRGFAYGILVSGIISVIWSFCTFCFVEEPYFVNSFNVEDSIKTRTVFKIEGIFISLAIAFSTISSFTFLMVFCNMSLTLKDIKHRINYGQMTVIKHPLPQTNQVILILKNMPVEKEMEILMFGPA
jgi:hypothetical protein